MRYDDRRGMTLVELLIVMVLGVVVLLAIYEVLRVNQRTYGVQNATVQGQQTIRAGMDMLFGELREISPADGDLVTMNGDELRVRTARSLGVICAVDVPGVGPIVRVRPIGRDLVEDSARVFFENDPNRTSDDDWRSARISFEAGTFNCPDGEPAQGVQLLDVNHGPPPDSLVVGSPIRNFVHYRYAVGTYGGETYLIREDSLGTESPLVGPLDDDGVGFRYLDASGSATITATDVRQVEVKLRTESEMRNASGEPYRDSLTARIYTRN